MAKSPHPFRVITCREWGAAKPRDSIQAAGRPVRTIFHHTAGHHPNLDAASGESYNEAAAYARAIQKAHMGQGWVDSGHNFLVCRNGFIFEGRHGSLEAISKGMMVVSAHCPGQNSQPGIEHEHLGNETMTEIQREASVWLHAFICKKTGMKAAACAQPHRKYFATACPGNLANGLEGFRR